MTEHPRPDLSSLEDKCNPVGKIRKPTEKSTRRLDNVDSFYIKVAKGNLTLKELHDLIGVNLTNWPIIGRIVFDFGEYYCCYVSLSQKKSLQTSWTKPKVQERGKVADINAFLKIFSPDEKTERYSGLSGGIVQIQEKEEKRAIEQRKEDQCYFKNLKKNDAQKLAKKFEEKKNFLLGVLKRVVTEFLSQPLAGPLPSTSHEDLSVDFRTLPSQQALSEAFRGSSDLLTDPSQQAFSEDFPEGFDFRTLPSQQALSEAFRESSHFLTDPSQQVFSEDFPEGFDVFNFPSQ